MTNVEFYNLQKEIREIQYNLLVLQDKHRDAKGVNFVAGQDISEPKMCEGCRFWEFNSVHPFCNNEDSEYFDRAVTDGCSEHDVEDGSSLY